MTRRTERIGEQIRGELARLLHEEVTDPRVGLVTITRIDVAPDLSHAKVFWSALDAVPHGSRGEKHSDAETAKGLASAAGFLRSQLARALATRRVPELRFVHDDSVDAGAETLRLLEEIRRGKA
ncbi:MAG: 30S ribosome-binding factor RbfA [Deltaproteobacteria bacterium]|nr:30S ribosome-binding factor RbfA [Deltaproteobacteria bacterium]